MSEIKKMTCDKGDSEAPGVVLVLGEKWATVLSSNERTMLVEVCDTWAEAYRRGAEVMAENERRHQDLVDRAFESFIQAQADSGTREDRLRDLARQRQEHVDSITKIDAEVQQLLYQGVPS